MWKIFKIALAYLKPFWVGFTSSAQFIAACHLIYSLVFFNSVVEQLFHTPFMCSSKFSFSVHNLFLNIEPHLPINTFCTIPQPLPCCLSHTGEICSLIDVGYSSRYDLLGRSLNLSEFCFSHMLKLQRMLLFRDMKVREVTHIFCNILQYLGNGRCSIDEDYTDLMEDFWHIEPILCFFKLTLFIWQAYKFQSRIKS